MDDELHNLTARVTALEELAKREARADAIEGLLNWLRHDQVNDLGRTRGKLLALEAFARAVASATPDRAPLAAALVREIAQAEADVMRLPIADEARGAARVGLQQAVDALRAIVDPSFTPPPAPPETPSWQLPEVSWKKLKGGR